MKTLIRIPLIALLLSGCCCNISDINKEVYKIKIHPIYDSFKAGEISFEQYKLIMARIPR